MSWLTFNTSEPSDVSFWTNGSRERATKSRYSCSLTFGTRATQSGGWRRLRERDGLVDMAVDNFIRPHADLPAGLDRQPDERDTLLTDRLPGRQRSLQPEPRHRLRARESSGPADLRGRLLLDVKADLEAVLAPPRCALRRWNIRRCTSVKLDGKQVDFIGELRPHWQQKYDHPRRQCCSKSMPRCCASGTCRATPRF